MSTLAADEGLPHDPRDECVRRVLVVGGGSSGWMAAIALATYTSRECQVTLVESDAIGIVGVGEATIPPIRQFNRFVRVDETAFLRETQGTFKLGIEFHNWGRIGDRYLHQFGRTGRELDEAVKLHHWWLAGRLAGEAEYPAYGDLFPAHALAAVDKFMPPNGRPRDPLNRHTYAYHFDANLYSKHLRRIAEERGAERVEGRITGVERDAGTGHVAAVVLEDGRRLEADLFIDCSGFRSLLLGSELEEPFEDWSRWLPADRALAVPTAPAPGPIKPYTQGIAHSVGWQWRIPLQHRTGNGHVFSSNFSSESEAEQRLLATLDAPALDQPRLLKFETGRRSRAWVGNVVAVGLSAGFLEPLESTSIHLVQSALERLIDHFPSRRMDPLLRDAFNAKTRAEWEDVRDFVIAHYKVTQRDDSEFWNYTRAMEVPDSLAATLKAWREHALLAIDGGHLFQLGSWSALLIGQRLFPQRVHALADRADPASIAQRLRGIVAELDQAAARAPDHAEFIAQNCAAPEEA
jgi:tryptophan halogenase